MREYAAVEEDHPSIFRVLDVQNGNQSDIFGLQRHDGIQLSVRDANDCEMQGSR